MDMYGDNSGRSLCKVYMVDYVSSFGEKNFAKLTLVLKNLLATNQFRHFLSLLLRHI